ncbi:pyrroline-5-carboxylate reductase [Agrobacterium rosae]|uniref:pyrroline-5-carboxylate reductase n=1 Tax=Agrobacterium rosae TaxID=1972867 RepID=UPI002549E128|nr:pyrroline-5-carboxylate reductase [Agrobacterium rosae]MCM2436100.1 pyrroline-5-carboxylate reductase [Agrobacterium rosae]
MQDVLPRSIVLVGAGQMGGAILKGWLGFGISPITITVIEPTPSDNIVSLAATHRFTLNPETISEEAEVVMLATKPQLLDVAAEAIRSTINSETLVISVLAGKTISDLKSRLPDTSHFVRAMPNLPASVNRGITAAVASSDVSPEARRLTTSLLGAIGKVEWLSEERQLDAATALSGSGPAYVFHLVETLASAGRQYGLPADCAERLARATIEGAGELLFRSPDSPSTLRQKVTSPGGTTAAALKVLMDEDGLQSLILRAVGAAKRRAEELAG